MQTRPPQSLPATVAQSIEVYLSTIPPLYALAVAVVVLPLGAINLTALLWGLYPSPRFIPAHHRGKAKHSTAILGAVLLALGVHQLLPGVGAELRAFLGLVSGAISGPLYDVLRPMIEAKTGIKLPESLTAKGESSELD